MQNTTECFNITRIGDLGDTGGETNRKTNTSYVRRVKITYITKAKLWLYGMVIFRAVNNSSGIQAIPGCCGTGGSLPQSRKKIVSKSYAELFHSRIHITSLFL